MSKLPFDVVDLGLDFRILPFDSTADHAATLLALDAAGHADIGVQDEAPDGVDPALVAGEAVVELGGHVANGVEASPGDSGEVVVFIVEADVVGEEVEGPIVGEGLGNGDAIVRLLLGWGNSLVNVMLGNEVAGKRVKTSSEERRDKEV